MSGYRKSLPPLNGLIFFECAARKLSFTEAAAELFVSQTAVSKRIRQLEDFLGVKLFNRDSRTLTLTKQGQELYGKTSITLDFLESAMSRLSEQSINAVQIASSNAVSIFWLQKQLKRFGFTEHACPVNFVTSDESRSLMAGEHDLLVLPWDSPPKGYDTIALFPERLVPVASPGVARKLNKSSQLGFLETKSGAKSTLLNYRRVEPFWVNWGVWAKSTAFDNLQEWPIQWCKTYTHAIGKAIQGEGIALGSYDLLRDELASRTLVQVSEHIVQSRNHYYLARNPASGNKTQVEHLYRFLLEAADIADT